MSKVSTISITPTTRTFTTPMGASGAIITSGSGTWTAAVSDPWITLAATSGAAGTACGYQVAVNTNVEQRVGYVYVAGYTHTITQAGQGGSIGSTNAEFEKDGGTGTVTVSAADKMVWHARPNVDWLSVSPTVGAGNGKVTFQVAPWYEVTTRSGTLTIAGQTFTVFQYGRRIVIEPTSTSCDYQAHVVPITVDALAIQAWSVVPQNSWLSVVDAGTGKGAGMATVAIAENPSYKARTGTVKVGAETFTVNQAGRTALSFSVSPTSTTASLNGANGLLEVLGTPDLPWTASTTANWLTLYNTTGAGNGNVVFVASPNSTLFERKGTITVTPEKASGVAAKNVTVTQPAQPSYVSSTGYEFAAAGESTSVDVTVANIVEWQVENTLSWINITSGTSYTGPGTVTIQASPNDTVYPRSGTIKIANKTFTVSQLGRGVKLSYDTIVFDTDGQPKNGGIASFSIEPDGNVSWTAVASDPTWIIMFGQTSGTGKGEIEYVIAPYSGNGEPRTGTITVGDKKVYITQRAYDLSITPSGTNVVGNAGAGEIGVSASNNDVWTAIVTEPWITVVSGYDAGKGNGTVRFTYTANDTGKTRTGKIVVSGEAYTLVQAARVIVNIKAEASRGGSVSGAGAYTLGEKALLTAVPSDGYKFDYWEGAVSTMQNPIEITADVSKTVRAVFSALTPDFAGVTCDTDGVALQWRGLAWANEYRIYRAPTGEKGTVPLVTLTDVTVSSYKDMTGDVGKTYWYWVEAVGDDDTTECVSPVAGAKVKPIVISSITYTNLRGATHSNTNAYREGTAVSFSLPQGGPVGYTFAGWSPAAITADMTGNQMVTANWTANAYSVTYHANGGSGTMKTTPMTYDVEGLVASNEFTFAGHRFVGWATSADGEVVYAEGAAVSNLTASVGGVYELWAKWAECKVEVPTIAPANGSFFGTPSCTVTLSCATEGATIYCRTGGGSPKATETYRYRGPFTISDTTIIKAFATKDGWTQSEILEATLTRIDLSLEAAIDVGSGVTVTTGGDASWETAVDDGAKTGGKCAQSGAISDGEESWIQLAVSGAGTMTFWTKVSCETDEPMHEFDHLAVYVDGVETTDFRLDGESDWVPRTVTFTTAGSHTVKVAYEKDESDAEGEDCAWLDGVVWTPSAAPVDPIPDIGDNPTAAEVAAAVAGATDPKVTANIDETNYNAFRDWAGTVKVKGGSAAGAQGVMAADNAWVSYALGQDTLLETAPTDEDLSVETFTPSVESGKFDFTVSVKDIEVGSEATKENLKKVFGLEGAATLDGAAFSSDKVDIEFATPVDGNVKFKAGPKDADAKAFFMKVKLNP